MVPILTQAQRDWLDEAKQLVQHKSDALIPGQISYKTYRSRFNKACDRAGILHRHGLRHLYVQNRYKALTGWECPAKGGPSKNQLTAEQKRIDRAIRLQLSAEVGHGRRAILSQYIGC